MRGGRGEETESLAGDILRKICFKNEKLGLFSPAILINS